MEKSQSFNSSNIISVVIRVRNAAAELRRSMYKLHRQRLPELTKLEIVVVDNESTDNSVSIARMFGAKIVSIKQEEFAWGRALNLGIEKTAGEIVLILSADTCPEDDQLIEKMISPFDDESVAAVYGRQLPYLDAPVDERIRLMKKFGSISQRFSLGNCVAKATAQGMPISNACAAIRKNVWHKITYDENIEAGEEGIWSYAVLQHGYSIVYQSSARIYHSHKDGALKLAWREWELLHKNTILRGYRLGKTKIFRWLACFVKRRLKNCMWPNLPFYIRVRGLISLPGEIMALTVVGFCPNREQFRRKLRRLFWK